MISKTISAAFFFCNFYATALASQNSSLKESDIFDMNEAKQFFLNFVNTNKSKQDMSQAQKDFVKKNNIDILRPIERIGFADEVRYFDKNKLYGKYVVIGPEYYPNNISKDRLIASISSSFSHGDGTFMYQNYCSITYIIDYEVKIPLSPKSQDVYHTPVKIHAPIPIKKNESITITSGPSMSFVKGVMTLSDGPQFTIGGKSYSAQEFEQETGNRKQPIHF